MALTIATWLARALEPYERLQALGETVEDEWQYVTDLSTAWRTRLAAVARDRGAEPVDLELEAVLAPLASTVDAMTDPHRAIDWLSTYPQVVLLALGEPA